MKKLVSIILLFLVTVNIFGNESNYVNETDIFQNENITFSQETLKKNYLVGFAGATTVNLFLLAWNRFMIGAGWTKVTWDKIWPLTERGIEFDTDYYWTNFVLHPYQGSLYYLSARNANLNRIESLGVTAFGSAMWEWFCETNTPSINDLVYTTIGGFVLGEILYRLSLEAAVQSTFLSFLFNPMKIVTNPFMKNDPVGPTGNIHELSFKMGMGTGITGTWFESSPDPTYNFDFTKELFPGSLYVEANVVYGNPYGHESKIPYSQFEFKMEGGIGFPSGHGKDEIETSIMYDINIFSNGMLFANSLDLGKNKKTTLGMSFLYDFMWHSFMEFTSLAPAFAIKQQITNNLNIFEWQFHLGAVLLGTSDFHYYRRGEGSLMIPSKHVGTLRDYGYSFGVQTKDKICWKNNNHKLNMDFNGYALYKFPYQVQKNDDFGWELIGFIDLSYEYFLTKKVALGISDELFLKTTFYNEKPNLFSLANTICLYSKFYIK